MSGGKLWSLEDKNTLEDMYKNGLSINEIKDKLNRTYSAVLAMSRNMNLDSRYTRTNSPNYKAEYQDYYWCYQKIIIEGKMPDEIANETGFSKRVIKKWTNEKYGLSNRTFKEYAQLTPIQFSLILAGTLGDGHIDKRNAYPIYIESHAENQKDYMFWKYGILKNLCNSEPKYYEPCARVFGGKKYNCQATYRMETRTINQLKAIREMDRIQKINLLDEFGFCTHMLDDGFRGDDGWKICFGDWTMEETLMYIKKINNTYFFACSLCKDTRYARFNKNDSEKIDLIILKNIPNYLDVIKYKITERRVHNELY